MYYTLSPSYQCRKSDAQNAINTYHSQLRHTVMFLTCDHVWTCVHFWHLLLKQQSKTWKSLLTIYPMPEHCHTETLRCFLLLLLGWTMCLAAMHGKQTCPLGQGRAQKCPGHCGLRSWRAHPDWGFWQCWRAWQQPWKTEKPSQGSATTCPTDRHLQDLWKNFVL